jgi:hypothetical protein
MAQLARKVRQSLEDNAKVGASVGAATVDNVRAHGLKLVSTTLPKAADATDKIGKNVADFVLTSSQSLAKTMRNNVPSTAKAVGSTWLLRRASRFIVRRPAVVLLGGAAIAAVGWAAWKLSQPQAEVEADIEDLVPEAAE